jgi:protein YIPF5/7
MDDSDLAGPFLFFFLFGSFLLLSGKVHFGYIYGLGLLGSILLHYILSLMTPSEPGSPPPSSHVPQPSYPGGPPSVVPGAPQQGGMGHDGRVHLSSTLTLARSASVLGYCLLPLVATSLLGVGMPMDQPVGIALNVLAIIWCTYSASGIFCAVGRMRGMRGLVAYPLALFYVGFGIMAVFSSRGSGTLARAAAAGMAKGASANGGFGNGGGVEYIIT